VAAADPPIADLARKVWGEPNRALSTKDELRFGSHGSKSVKLKERIWCDHETGESGGYLDMHQMALGKLPPPPTETIAATYDYRDEAGTLRYQVVRKIPKKFVQRAPDGAGGWVWSTKGITKIPYRLPELIAAAPDAPVFVAEGEKDCNRLAELGFVATTNPGGAGKWLASMSAYLRGRHVVVLPDNDEAGRLHAEDLRAKLTPVAASLRVLALPHLPEKGDVSDWLANGGSAGALLELVSRVGAEDAVSAPSASKTTKFDGFDDASPFSPSATPAPAKIRVLQGERHLAADAGINALVAACVPFYQRDRGLVRCAVAKAKSSDGRVIKVPGIVPVTNPVLARALGQSARWTRANKDGELRRIDPPKEVVEQIAAMTGEWPFAPLAGVIGTPTLRPDGSLLATEGYDEQTGLYLLAPPQMPALMEIPTWWDAQNALTLLANLLTEFPFSDEISRSVAISMILTAVLRGALAPAVPMHVVTAPQPGTGKSYLLDTAAAIATGERCPAIAMAPNDPKETEKRLVGAALAGFPVIALDNVSEMLTGDFLAQVTERPVLVLRPLGGSAMIRITNTFTVFANGNNLSATADMVRRTLRCGLDSNLENPEEREFKTDPVAMVLEDRGKYVAACLTIARAYLVAGKPNLCPRLPSFGAWSDMVRSALVWLKLPDPVMSMDFARADDPARQARAALFEAWAAQIVPNEKGYTTAEVVEMANEFYDGNYQKADLRAACLAVARDRAGTGIQADRLGRWLKTAANNRAGSLKLVVNHDDKARPRWSLLVG
jgi:putative DNA primase/helicase